MTKIFSHRGSRGTRPENTLAAFQEAVRVQSDGIELDVHVSKDGALVVIHDETVDRTTNGSGSIQDLTVEEIQALDAGSWFHESFTGEKIPTLEEVFQLLKELNFKGELNIELKTDQIEYAGIVEKCVALQEKMQPNFAIIYSSFNPRSIIQMKQLRPNQEIAFLYESVEMANFVFEEVNFEAVHPDYRLLKEAFEIHSQYPKRVWTVNQEEEMNHCFKLHVEAIFTDYPQKALELRGEIKE